MRVINIDEDTSVGYIYEEQKYFVTNKGTTTKRNTAEEIKQVLDIVAPDNTITENDYTELKDNYEELTELYFTYSDDGSYIATIQMNDYSKYPLTINPEKSKLYIMNTEIIFDLTLNEGRRDRILRIQAFYKDVLGLLVDKQDLIVLYSTLTNFYSPTCYNQIYSTENPDGSYSYKYNQYINLSNYRGNSPATYSLLCNPYGKYSYETIGHILQIQDNAILLTDTVTDVQEGDTLVVRNTDYSMGAYSYSANSTITVSEVLDNIITATENLPSTFVYTPPTLNLIAYKTPVMDIDRDAQTITLTNIEEASQFLIGDVVQVQDTLIRTEYETLTVDGAYTIIGIKDNVLYINETPITNYTSPIGYNPAYVYKPIRMGCINSITNLVGGNGSRIILETPIPTTLEVGNQVAISTPNIDNLKPPTIQYGTIAGLDDEYRVVIVSELLEPYTAKYGLLRKPVPFSEVQINILYSNAEDEFPTGEFIVDNSIQAVQYLKLMDDLVYPSESSFGRFSKVNAEVETLIPVEFPPKNPENPTPTVILMRLLGLYSHIYNASN